MKPSFQFVNQWPWARKEAGHVNPAGVYVSWIGSGGSMRAGVGIVIMGIGAYLSMVWRQHAKQ